MILSYSMRLLSLSLASFFLLYAASGLAVWLAAPFAIRLTQRLQPRAAAMFLFCARILPLALAAIVVVFLCVPAYYWIEPDIPYEPVGFVCLALAALGAATLIYALARDLLALVGTFRFIRNCRRAGGDVKMPGVSFSALLVEAEAPLFLLTGIFRPRLVLTRGVLRRLTGEQLEVALRHERAHWHSRDNLKRLLLQLAPGIYPFSRGFTALEHAWTRLSEWAADEEAAGGDAHRALSLAEALLCVARSNAALQPPLLCTSLAADHQGLEDRVNRLLSTAPPSSGQPKWLRPFRGGIILLLSVLLGVALLQSATFSAVHRLLESLLH